MRGLTGPALADVYMLFGEFHAETLALYQQRYGRRVSAIAEELFAAAVLTREEVMSMRNCDLDLVLSERVIRNLLRSSDSLPE